MITAIIPIFLSGKPEVNPIMPIIAIITPVDPKSLWTPATTIPVKAISIMIGCNVFLVFLISPFCIRSTRNTASQIISVSLIISAIWNDKPPTWIHRVAPLTSSPAIATMAIPIKVNATNILRAFFSTDTDIMLAKANTASPSPIAISCLTTK